MCVLIIQEFTVVKIISNNQSSFIQVGKTSSCLTDLLLHSWVKVMLSRGKTFSRVRSYLSSACRFLEFLQAARRRRPISATQTQAAEILQVLKKTRRDRGRRNVSHLKLSSPDAIATCLRLAPGRVESLLGGSPLPLPFLTWPSSG